MTPVLDEIFSGGGTTGGVSWEVPLMGTLTDNGRWVTLDSGQHVYVTDWGQVVPTVEQAEATKSLGEKRGGGKSVPVFTSEPSKSPDTGKPATKGGATSFPQEKYPALEESSVTSGGVGAPKMPSSDSPAVKSVPEADRAAVVSAFRKLDTQGDNHVDLHRLGKELGWSREKLAHVLASARDKVSMQTHEGYGGVTDEERGYLLADSSGSERYGAVRLRGTGNVYLPPVINDGGNCGVGSGGFQPGNTCAKGGDGAELPVSMDAKVKAFAEEVKNRVADMVGGLPEELTTDAGQRDKKPYDVQVPGGRGKPPQDIEVKTVCVSKDKNKSLSVHDDALMRKVEHQEATGNGFHTVAVDARQTFDGGANAEHYSGHDLYYKRGSGRYSLNQMHRVKDAAELKRLLKARDEDLPEAARGSLPPPPPKAELRERADKAKESRQAKDKALKEKNKDKLREQARARAVKAKALKSQGGV